MPRPRSLVIAVTVTLGCLPAFAPNIRATGVHASVSEPSVAASCMDCHVSEQQALELDAPTSAPIVADWMLIDARSCVDCHRVRAHPRRAALDRLPSLALPSLAKVGRAK